ncbi:DHHC palmitoyltransferase-domain-containing protein [Irpex rosettiformis]|uniref:DHHC palmitoyltransferase-domain-containing protein n=1 Tax=Irpex rosettiformis TaxID=378272 RepID=A0ACB8U098_9APHY|nr:DHHC palmitoyltransferase-domain-containing protein [Irpex rosettiformis]
MNFCYGNTLIVYGVHVCPVTFLFLLAPQPSWLIVLVNYHLRILRDPWLFARHLAISYTLTILAFCSLITIILRDPGRPNVNGHAVGDADGDVDITQALLADDLDISCPGKFCRKCWAPKPPRTHHCQHCGRCVLKMDHHCMWLGYKCIGHRTYTSFLHFLACITLLAMYIGGVCASSVYYAFDNPLSIDEQTPLHEMSLALAGIIFTMVIGPFLVYHMFLVTTNQTTLEHISPFLLLRELPPLPPQHSSDRYRLSEPPLEHELSFSQRRLVRDAHGYIKLYDMGWRGNWAQVVGWEKPFGWVNRIVVGGGCKGDGISYPRNPKADELLARLAAELVDADKVH